MPRIFVSHSSADELHARRVAKELEGLGAQVWLAVRDLPGGSLYAAQIPVEMDGADAVVVLLSHFAVRSAHVDRELSLAVDAVKVLFPLALSRDYRDPRHLPPQWRYWLGTVQIAPLDRKGEWKAAIANRLGMASAPDPAPGEMEATPHHPPSVAAEQAVRSLLIQAGVRGLSKAEICARARRLKIPTRQVEQSIETLRAVNLITYEGSLVDTTKIRLT